MTDYYPDEEGYVDEGYAIGWFYPDAAINEGASVFLTGTTAGRIRCRTVAATGEGIGVALRAATGAGAPARIPVAILGVVKMMAASTIAVGDFVGSGATTGLVIEFDGESDQLLGLGGTAYLLGLALQAAATTGPARGPRPASSTPMIIDAPSRNAFLSQRSIPLFLNSFFLNLCTFSDSFPDIIKLGPFNPAFFFLAIFVIVKFN